MREAVKDSKSCQKLVRRIIENYSLPYITISPLFSVCEKHGYISGEYEYCPLCDEEIIIENS